MDLLKYFANPALLIISLFFITSIVYCVHKYIYINKNIENLLSFLQKFKKSDITYRFKEFDDGLTSNPYVSNIWVEFRNTLVFSENVTLKGENEEVVFENATQTVSGIQTTVDSSYFFNEETLVTSRFNYKFVQVTPTLLTGLGPLFTFMHIAYAFANVNFLSNETTMASIEGLMASMQIAALCSVLAVGASLIFMLVEKLLYNYKCKIPLANVQELLYKFFDSVTSEKFLIELLKTTKIQNNSMTKMMNMMPQNFKEAMDKSLSSILVPYLDNIIFGIDKIKEKNSISAQKTIESIDELF